MSNKVPEGVREATEGRIIVPPDQIPKEFREAANRQKAAERAAERRDKYKVLGGFVAISSILTFFGYRYNSCLAEERTSNRIYSTLESFYEQSGNDDHFNPEHFEIHDEDQALLARDCIPSGHRTVTLMPDGSLTIGVPGTNKCMNVDCNSGSCETEKIPCPDGPQPEVNGCCRYR